MCGERGDGVLLNPNISFFQYLVIYTTNILQSHTCCMWWADTTHLLYSPVSTYSKQVFSFQTLFFACINDSLLFVLYYDTLLYFLGVFSYLGCQNMLYIRFWAKLHNHCTFIENSYLYFLFGQESEATEANVDHLWSQLTTVGGIMQLCKTCQNDDVCLPIKVLAVYSIVSF